MTTSSTGTGDCTAGVAFAVKTAVIVISLFGSNSRSSGSIFLSKCVTRLSLPPGERASRSYTFPSAARLISLPIAASSIPCLEVAYSCTPASVSLKHVCKMTRSRKPPDHLEIPTPPPPPPHLTCCFLIHPRSHASQFSHTRATTSTLHTLSSITAN